MSDFQVHGLDPGGSSWFVGLCGRSAIEPCLLRRVLLHGCRTNPHFQAIVSRQECQGLYAPKVFHGDPTYCPTHLQQVLQAMTTAAAPVLFGNRSLRTLALISIPRADRDPADLPTSHEALAFLLLLASAGWRPGGNRSCSMITSLKSLPCLAMNLDLSLGSSDSHPTGALPSSLESGHPRFIH